jgi:hypothetical protein
MRLEQTENAILHVLSCLRSAILRDDDRFIADVMDALQDFRKVRGHSTPLARDVAYSGANFILKRLKSRGWQFSPPLMPMVGGLTGARKKD